MKNNLISLIAHYIKDLSFENPNYPHFFGSNKKFQSKNFTINISSQLISKDLYEIDLAISAKTEFNQKTLFLCELTYAGMFKIADKEKEKLILENAPEHLYPFARKVLIEIIRVGGFSKILLPENFSDFKMTKV